MLGSAPPQRPKLVPPPTAARLMRLVTWLSGRARVRSCPMTRTHKNPTAIRTLTGLAVAAALLATNLTAASSGDLQSQITATQSAAQSMRAQIAADSAQIARTSGGLAHARSQLAAVQADLDRRVAQLKTVQSSLLDLENRLHVATTALAANLVANYEGNQPNLMTVILSSHGFGQLLEQVNFMSRVAHQDSHVVAAPAPGMDNAAASHRETRPSCRP